MAHVPHLYLPRPWGGEVIAVTDEHRHHLDKVLRMRADEPVSYTDGEGTVGSGDYRSGSVRRGEEKMVPRPSDLVVVVAPPEQRDRARFLIEKLAELGVSEVRFLRSSHGEGRPPKVDRSRSWAMAALEQSRGGWLMKIAEGLVTLDDLGDDYVICHPGGADRSSARTVVIGPEGGWAPGELPDGAPLLDLGDTVLRVETAALVAAARML